MNLKQKLNYRWNWKHKYNLMFVTLVISVYDIGGIGEFGEKQCKLVGHKINSWSSKQSPKTVSQICLN